VATSRLSEVEIASALWRRSREGTLTARQRSRALAALVDDFAAIHVVELSPQVSSLARELLEAHALRAGDAIQLASAVTLRRELAMAVEFVAFDQRLNAAAAAAGLTIETSGDRRARKSRTKSRVN
jgi:predicted nucleic acid-binding protein